MCWYIRRVKHVTQLYSLAIHNEGHNGNNTFHTIFTHFYVKTLLRENQKKPFPPISGSSPGVVNVNPPWSRGQTSTSADHSGTVVHVIYCIISDLTWSFFPAMFYSLFCVHFPIILHIAIFQSKAIHHKTTFLAFFNLSSSLVNICKL